jgi:hypothetical protein
MKKHKYTHSHIEHHKDGSHTVHHVHEDGPHKDVKYAASGHDEMIDGLMDHTSEPNPGEEQDEAGKALPQAAPAAVPAPAAQLAPQEEQQAGA